MEADRKRKTYDQQFKIDAVSMAVNGDRSAIKFSGNPVGGELKWDWLPEDYFIVETEYAYW